MHFKSYLNVFHSPTERSSRVMVRMAYLSETLLVMVEVMLASKVSSKEMQQIFHMAMLYLQLNRKGKLKTGNIMNQLHFSYEVGGSQ